MATKVCTKCKKRKKVDRFGQRRRKSGVAYNSWCYDCQNEAVRQSRKNPETRKKNSIGAMRRQRKLAEEVRLLKESVPCTDCKKKHPYWRMQFDHIGSDKVANVSRLMSNCCRKKLFDEIEKCELVCANCHTDRTHARRAVKRNTAHSSME